MQNKGKTTNRISDIHIFFYNRLKNPTKGINIDWRRIQNIPQELAKEFRIKKNIKNLKIKEIVMMNSIRLE